MKELEDYRIKSWRVQEMDDGRVLYVEIYAEAKGNPPMTKIYFNSYSNNTIITDQHILETARNGKKADCSPY